MTNSALVINKKIQVKRWWSAEQRNARGTACFGRQAFVSPLVELLFVCISLLLVLGVHAGVYHCPFSHYS